MEESLRKLEWFLEFHHPNYTIKDVKLSAVKGYLNTKIPCNCNNTMCRGGFYHTIDITGVGYPTRDEKGRFVSQYKLWNELHGLLLEGGKSAFRAIYVEEMRI